MKIFIVTYDDLPRLHFLYPPTARNIINTARKQLSPNQAEQWECAVQTTEIANDLSYLPSLSSFDVGTSTGTIVNGKIFLVKCEWVSENRKR